MCSVPYGLLRRRGLGVRYAHGTGNDADVGGRRPGRGRSLHDPDIRLVLLYLEDIRDPGPLERARQARTGRGRSRSSRWSAAAAPTGQRAAVSHTGALASERRVVDAFFERCGIWQARYMRRSGRGRRAVPAGLAGPRGRRLAVVSNSGAVCVLGADAAGDHGLDAGPVRRRHHTGPHPGAPCRSPRRRTRST